MADKDNKTYTGLSNYANYHTFSKLQVGNSVNFGGAINRSGHTVTNTDAWLDDVPFYGSFSSPSVALAAIGASTVKNDLVKIAVGEGDIPAGIYRRNNVDNTAGDKTFTEIFTLYTIGTDKKDGASVLLNKNDKAVVRVWSSQELTLLDGANNSNADSEGQAARIIVNNAPVEQFIAVPDVARSGYPSAGYGIKVYEDSTGIAKEMTMDFDGLVKNTFFDVAFAGVIMFGGGTVTGTTYTIDCFEYIGDKLAAVNTKIADIQETIENLTIEAGEGIKQIKTVEGSGITVATEGVEGATALTPVIGIDTNVIATKASVDAVAEDVSEIQQTIESGVVSSVTASAAAQAAGITVSGTDTEPEIQVAVGEVSDTSDAIVTGKAVAAAIETAKQAAINGAKVTLAQGTGITVSPSGIASTTFTIAVDDTVATAQSVTDLAGRVTSAEGEIDTLQETVEGLTSGENSVDSKITAAKTEITGTEIAEQSVSGAGITVTLNGTVGAPNLTGSVTTATYTPATETTAGSWSEEANVAKASDVKAALADVTTKHTADIEKVEAAIESLSTSGFSREIVTELPTTDIKLNAIYLVANKESDSNEYIEYIYVGGTVTDGQVSGGRFEQIGTTKTDLSEYAKTADVNTALALKADQTALDSTNAEVAKKANSADVYTKTEIDGKVTTINSAIEAADTKGQQGITDAAAAKSAADAAQADATQALADAATAQGEIDALEGVVSALSQVVADNKTATDAAIATKADQTALDATNTTVAGHTTAIETLNDTTIPAITDRLDAIEAIPTVEVVAAEGTEGAPNYVTVSSETAGGKTTFTVASTGALETRLDTLESFVGGTGTPGQGLSELLAKKVDNVTGGSNGVTITTADTADGRVATLSVTPDTQVTKGGTNVVTSGAVETAISTSASTTLDSAKSYAEEQVEALATELNAGEVSANNTEVSVTQENGKITTVTVTKGAIAINNTNLVDGGTVYAVTSDLQTKVDKKLDSTAYTTDKQAIEGRLNTAEGEIDALQEFVNGANDAYAAKSTETAAANAQTSANKKLASITTTDNRITLGAATADGDTKSQSISLASNVATVDSSETTTDGTVYTKAQTDSAISAAVGTAVQSVALADSNTQTAISVETSDANAVTFTVADNIATVDKVTVGEDGTITVDTQGDVYSKETIDKMVSEAAPENYIASITSYNTALEEVTTAQGAAVKVLDGRGENVHPIDLWGTTVNMVDNTITIQGGPIDGTAWGGKNGYNTKGGVSANGTSYPKGSNTITKVENNMVYNGADEVANIKTNEIVNGFYMFGNTSLESFSGDLSSLVNGVSMFESTSLTSFNSNLSNLVNGQEMFYGCVNLESFSGDLSNLVNGYRMFYLNNSLTSFSNDLSNLVNGQEMFYGSSSLTSFSGDLSSLVNGYAMFKSAKLTSFNNHLNSLVNGASMFESTSLTSFNGNLSNLILGSYMFRYTSLTSFNGDLSNLFSGACMFQDTSLESFNGDLSNLVNGASMFESTSLESFNGDLSGLIEAEHMFRHAPLTSFSGDLSSLDIGYEMFSNCKLSADSMMYIADGIKDWGIRDSEGNLTGTTDNEIHTITIDVDSTLTSDAEVAEYLTEIANKGWTVATNHTISAAASAAIDGTQNGVFVIARPVENEEMATHTTADGKFVAVESAVSVIGIHQNQWAIFPAVEDALTEWELTPIVK